MPTPLSGQLDPTSYTYPMSTSLRLAQTVRDIEDALDSEADPIARMVATDHVRADLAQVLTRTLRRCAYQARQEGRWWELREASWRSSNYLGLMARQYADDNGLPRTRVWDIISPQVLDLDDLRVLRGQSR